jgi:hypothetical protein
LLPPLHTGRYPPAAVATANGWAGKIHDRQEPATDSLTLDAPIEQGVGGSSGSFWGLGSDERRWRVKPLNGAHGEMASVNEFVVGRVGAVIRAPVCEVALVRITDETAGWEFQSGRYLEVGVAPAAAEIVGCHEERALTHRHEDDNRRRHVGIYALYDWCLGGDDQWLYETPAGEQIHSHDHGLYMRTDWRAQDLSAQIAMTHTLGAPTDGLDPDAKEDLARNLEAVNAGTLESILMQVPPSWPVTDQQLESLGHFLETRAPQVAARVRAL